MRFLAPQWFVLVPVLAVAAWQWPRLGLHRPLRIACLALVVLLLAEPQVRRQGDGLDLWLLVDQSESARDSIQPRLAEWQTILEKSRGPDDRILVVDFAAEAVTRGALLRAGAAATDYAGSRAGSRLATAIGHALGQMPPDRAARLLALTDGFSTEPLDGVAEKLLARGVALDTRLPPRPQLNDYAIARLDLPPRIQAREGVVGEVTIRGGSDRTVEVEILRDGTPLARKPVTLVDGSGRLRFGDRVVAPGAHRYAARLTDAADAFPGNDRAERWVEVQGGERVLLVTSFTDPPLAAALRAAGIDVQVVDDLATAHVGMLTGAAAVILDNVPAYKLDPAFVKGLDFYVTAQGGGLAMTGGRFAFASGGWFASPVDPLLPVSLELKQEHRKLAVALAIVMDRSGSMAMTVPGSGRAKMDLADEGAARAIELLGDRDLAVLIPVDSAAHPLSKGLVAVGPNRGDLVRAARSVESEGGGIFVYTGLDEAWRMLREATVGQRHVILFADAADAEEPGDYEVLLAEMAREKCTVSVIGLGTDTDCDAAFLQDVAKRGGGRIFFNADPNDLPALFEMETATIARSAFIEEPTPVKGTPGWLEIAAAPLDWPAAVDGYNLCYLKPRASQGAVSGDEYAAPLVAFWQKGAGRAAAVTFPMAGERSEAQRAWPGYADFAQSLARWLVGTALPPGIGLRTDVDGTRIRFDLFHDDSWAGRLAADPPQLAVARGADGAAVPVPWERLAPGHWSARVDAAGTDYVRGAVRLGAGAIAAGPVNVASNPEYDFDRARLDELAAASRRSGGADRVDLSDVWRAPRPTAFQDIRRWLLPLLSALIVLEALQARTGWRFRAARS
ncbi:MAG: hypothetical protein ACKOSQ_06165 [Planctomycetaceae bacterium]